MANNNMKTSQNKLTKEEMQTLNRVFCRAELYSYREQKKDEKNKDRIGVAIEEKRRIDAYLLEKKLKRLLK